MAKVIVIDDSLSVCFAIERMLRAHGMEVVSHRSGEAALHNLVAEAPDLVLCDLVLPDIEGFQICTFIREHEKLGHVPVIVISGIVDEEVRAQARRVGAVAVLKKPFASEEMLTLVKSILREKGALESSEDNQEAAPAFVDLEPPAPSLDDLEPPARPRILLADDDEPTGPSEVEAPEEEPQEPELLDLLEERLAPLAAIEALRFACILSPEGELRGYGPAKPTATDLAALPQLMRAASNTATHTRHGEVRILTLEASNGGVLVVKPQEEGHLMILGLGDLSVLGKARYLLRRLDENPVD